jgi:hypothetical protein
MSTGQLADLLALVGALGVLEFGGLLIAAKAVPDLAGLALRPKSPGSILTPSRCGFFGRLRRVAPTLLVVSLALTVTGLTLRWVIGG